MPSPRSHSIVKLNRKNMFTDSFLFVKIDFIVFKQEIGILSYYI